MYVQTTFALKREAVICPPDWQRITASLPLETQFQIALRYKSR